MARDLRKEIVRLTEERARLIRQLAQPELDAALQLLDTVGTPNPDMLELVDRVYTTNPNVGLALIKRLAPFGMRFNEAAFARALNEAIAECS